jgi:membrane-associated phospholipid phosphatase
LSEVLAGGLLGFIIGALVMLLFQLRRKIGWLTKQLRLKQLSKEAIGEIKKGFKDLE